ARPPRIKDRHASQHSRTSQARWSGKVARATWRVRRRNGTPWTRARTARAPCFDSTRSRAFGTSVPRTSTVLRALRTARGTHARSQARSPPQRVLRKRTRPAAWPPAAPRSPAEARSVADRDQQAVAVPDAARGTRITPEALHTELQTAQVGTVRDRQAQLARVRRVERRQRNRHQDRVDVDHAHGRDRDP